MIYLHWRIVSDGEWIETECWNQGDFPRKARWRKEE